MNEGVFLGAFKGVIFNFAQLGFVLYPSVYFANKNGGDNKFLSFITSYTLFDALFYPVDTLKNILYADTLGTYSIQNDIQTSKLLRIALVSLIYIVEFLLNLYTIFLSYQEFTTLLKSEMNIWLLLVGQWLFCSILSTPKKWGLKFQAALSPQLIPRLVLLREDLIEVQYFICCSTHL